MQSKFGQMWIPLEKVEQFIQLEPVLVTLGLALMSWIMYKLFLRNINPARHDRMSLLFKNLGKHITMGLTTLIIYSSLRKVETPNDLIDRVTAYVGLVTIIFGATVFVKICRILVFEYLFLRNMRAGVPLLLVNIFTLLLSIILTGWVVADIFSIRLAPLLATSAMFSLVLGLALQDTLGNLFAGVALQFDKPYEIGDWVEINPVGTTQKWVGQVQEISWRATILLGLTDETFTVPNRIMGQAQIANFSTKSRPIIRSQVFKIPFGVSLSGAKAALLDAVQDIEGVRTDPAPLVLVIETTESWISLRLIYFIDNYGAQFLVGDKVLNASILKLNENQIELASNRMIVIAQSNSAI